MSWADRASTYANDAGGFSGKTSGSTTAVTMGAAVVAGDLLILGIFAANAGSGTTPTFSVSDSVNGATGWVEVKRLTQASGTNNGACSLWVRANSGAGTPVITVTLTGPGGTGMFGGLQCAAFSGCTTSSPPTDVAVGATSVSSSPASGASAATAAANELVVGLYADFGSGDTIGAGTIGGVAATLCSTGGKHSNDGNFWQGLLEFGDSGSSGSTPTATATKSTSDNWFMIEGIFTLAGGSTTPASTDTATLTDTANKVVLNGPSEGGTVGESDAIGTGSGDSATLAEQNAIALLQSDSAAFADQVAIASATATSDTAALAESIKLALGATDSAHLGEAMALALAHQDSATLQELVSVALAIADAASLTESASVTQNGGNTPSASDSASLTDTATSTAHTSASDIGALAEQAAIALKVTDVASMTERLGLGLIAVDSAALVEQLQLAVANAGSDAGALGELQSVVASVLAAAEAVSMADTARVSQNGVSSTALKIFLVGVRPLTLEAPTRAFTFTLPHAFTFTLPTP